MPKSILFFLATIVAVAVAVSLIPAAPDPPAQHLAAVIDYSDSMPEDQEFYLRTVHDGLIDPLSHIDVHTAVTVDVFVAGANALTKPLHLDLPPVRGRNLAIDSVAQQARDGAPAAILDFVKSSLQGPRAHATALLAQLGRLPHENGIKLLLISDGAECNKTTVCLEHTPVKGHLDELVQKATAAVSLSGLLDRAEVQFRVPDLQPNAFESGVNDVSAVREFWESYFQKNTPTVRLISFDSKVVPF